KRELRIERQKPPLRRFSPHSPGHRGGSCSIGTWRHGKRSDMRFIDWDEVHRFADYSSVIDAMARMYASGCDAMDRMIMCQPTADGDEGDFLMQPAWMRGKAFGIKIANVFPANERRGKPSILGVYVLFDGNSGELLACVDGPAETMIKTACNSSLATPPLAPARAGTMLMMGDRQLGPSPPA